MRIGVDIIDVKRIKRLIKNKNFLARVYSQDEVDYCRLKKKQEQHFAVRFATKEAVWKALSDRDRKGVGHRDISVQNEPDGKPSVIVKGKRRRDIDISLSHTDEYAVAVALVK
jgi:holo-[acyl-carrier protein] synthase